MFMNQLAWIKLLILFNVPESDINNLTFATWGSVVPYANISKNLQKILIILVL